MGVSGVLRQLINHNQELLMQEQDLVEVKLKIQPIKKYMQERLIIMKLLKFVMILLE